MATQDAEALIRAELDNIAQWVQRAVAEGAVRGLSIVLVDAKGPTMIPQHVFFAAPGASPVLAGGYILAMTELAGLMSRGAAVPLPEGDPPFASEDDPEPAAAAEQPPLPAKPEPE